MSFRFPSLRPFAFLFAGLFLSTGMLHGQPRPETYWNVKHVRPGMKGQGKTVIKGTKVESFDVEILGILHNTNPGRDLVLASSPGATWRRPASSPA